MIKKILSFVLVLLLITSVTAVNPVFSAATNDGTVYTDTWVPGVDAGQSGDVNKLSVETVSDSGESYYLYTSVNGKSDAPLIYRQRTASLFEMTFMLTDSGSRVCYMPVFYDSVKGGENWSVAVTVSEAGGVVISNIADASSNNIFTEEEDGWNNGKYTFVPSVEMNKKHTIRVEHNPDELTFTVRFNGHTLVLGENPESAFVVSTKTGLPDARNSKGPRFIFAGSTGQSFRVYDMYMRGTVAGNTDKSKTASVFSDAREYTYEGELKVVSTYPENESYGIGYDETTFSLEFNQPLSDYLNDEPEVDISYASDSLGSSDVGDDEFTFETDAENGIFRIFMNDNLKKGVRYTVSVANIYSQEGNPLKTFTFSFITDDGTKEILDAVNSAESMRELGNVLNTYKSDIGLTDADYSDYNSNRNVISWVYKFIPYSDIKGIKSHAESAVKMKSGLDECDEDTIEDFVLEYSDVLFDDKTAYEKYTDFSDIHKAMANAMVISCSPFVTLIDFADTFITQVNSISADDDSSEESGEKLICDFTQTGVSGWTPSKEGNEFIKESTPDFADGKSLGRYYIPETTTNQYRMDHDLKFSDVSDCDTLYIWAYSPSNSGNPYALVVYCGNNDAGQWVDFRKVMNVDFEGWKLIALPFSSFTKTRSPSWESVSQLRIGQAGMGITEAIGGTEIYFAKMWFGNSAKNCNPEVISSNATDGTSGFGVGDALEYEFSEEIFINPANPPYITDSEGVRIDSEVSLEGNVLIISPTEPLKETSVYTSHLVGIADLSAKILDEQTHVFSTSGKGLYASAPVFSTGSLPESGSVCAAVNYGNNSDTAQVIELVVVAYGKNGEILEISSSKAEALSGFSDKTLLCTISAESYEGAVVRAFSINHSDSSKPVNAKTAELRAGDAPADKQFESFEKNADFSDGSIDINNIYVNVDTVKIEICAQDEITVPVSVKVSDDEGDLKYANQSVTDKNGCLTLEFNLNPQLDKGGNYTVEVSSLYMTNSETVKKDFYYLDTASKERILKLVNESASKSAVADILDKNKVKMSLPDIDYTSGSNMYISNIIYRDKPYKSYADIVSAHNMAVAALKALNENYWSSYKDVIDEYESIIFDNDYVVSKFRKLSSSEQNKVSQKVYDEKPFVSFDDFEDALSDAIAELGKSSGTGGSGGSGGGGKSSGAKGGYTTVPDVDSGAEIADDKYTDLQTCAWAEEYIYNLKSKGVLTMGADRKFRPDDNITREEFVKMLVIALGINEVGDADFTDVSVNEWYYPFIAKAYNAGVVTGVSQSEFGVGKYITREQMATMAYRALGVTYAPEASALFDDDANISDYAKNAVYYMKERNVINGMGNNMFSPDLYASRAQAAKIISLIMGS